MITVYAIKSTQVDWIYVGQTNNIQRRLHEHNEGFNKSTKPYRPFDLIFTENFPDRAAARTKEKYLKSAAGKRKLKRL